MDKLSNKMREILEEVIDKRRPELKRLLPYVESMQPFDNKDVDALCSELTRELCETGFKKDNQPNERGKILYKLTGYVNQLLKE
ncbi:MAG: hypothetical protein JXB29_07390 [Sedimentisphaerales bacterium]|nr:hypothetical protein [Sedimentisphaerales bacterium]